jgi:hypothetical protein
MGHQSNDARSALRAYARDLQTTAQRGGVASPVGASKQDDAPTQFLGSGAPHQLAIAAAVVCVVLLGGIGFAAATSTEAPSELLQAGPTSAPSGSWAAVVTRDVNVSTAQAIQAFSDLGLSRSADIVASAGESGIDASPAFQQALADLVSVVDKRISATGHVDENDLGVTLAVKALEEAVRPPGLDVNRIAPGLGRTAPGLDPTFLAPGQDPNFVPPSQDPKFTPPGQIKEKPDKAKQDKAKPDKDKGTP